MSLLVESNNYSNFSQKFCDAVEKPSQLTYLFDSYLLLETRKRNTARKFASQNYQYIYNAKTNEVSTLLDNFADPESRSISVEQNGDSVFLWNTTGKQKTVRLFNKRNG